MATTVRLVRAFHEATNERDNDRLLALAHDDFEFRTPRDLVRGKEGLRDWLARQAFGVGIFVYPERFFARDETVIATGRMELRFVDTGELGEEGRAVAIFTVEDGLVITVDAENTDLMAAFEATGMSELDEVSA